jgi:hypothetical protein
MQNLKLGAGLKARRREPSEPFATLAANDADRDRVMEWAARYMVPVAIFGGAMAVLFAAWVLTQG